MSESTNIPEVRQAEWAALWTCACKFSKICNPGRQAVALQVGATTESCIAVPGFQAGLNPTRLTEEAPF